MTVWDTNKFIEKSNEVHNKLYNYSKVNYTRLRDKVCIICPEHGEFWQYPETHLQGQGCPKCGVRKSTKNRTWTTEKFIKIASELHNNRYDYSKVVYINQVEPVEIVCPIHGSFWQKPINHIKRDRITLRGCPLCAHISKGEEIIKNYLISQSIDFSSQFSISVPKYIRKSQLIRVDFYFQNNNKAYIIEYNGLQHYQYIPHFHKNVKTFRRQMLRDRWLELYCLKHDIQLIIIDYKCSYKNIIKLLTIKIKNDGNV